MLGLKGVLTGESFDKEISDIDEALLFAVKPGIFTGSESLEISYDKNFDEMCIFISQKLNLKAEDLTVLTFYNALEYIKKTTKDNGGQSNTSKRPVKK
jgi:hypothetical protein